jgi:hypothetical protein
VLRYKAQGQKKNPLVSKMVFVALTGYLVTMSQVLFFFLLYKHIYLEISKKGKTHMYIVCILSNKPRLLKNDIQTTQKDTSKGVTL